MFVYDSKTVFDTLTLTFGSAKTPDLYLCTIIYKINKMSSPLENLETQLEMFIENVRQIRIIVSDFQPQGQSVLNQKMYVATHFSAIPFCTKPFVILTTNIIKFCLSDNHS